MLADSCAKVTLATKITRRRKLERHLLHRNLNRCWAAYFQISIALDQHSRSYRIYSYNFWGRFFNVVWKWNSIVAPATMLKRKQILYQ